MRSHRLSIAIIACTLPAGPALACDFLVHPNPALGDYTNIQDAIDVANEGELDLTYIRWLESLGIAISKLNPRAGGGTSTGGRDPVKFARYPKGSPNAARGARAFSARLGRLLATEAGETR